ncbi:hypothetical protein TrVGV298_004760 [Trichoderma virens]|nr:hypothetical protein TrVGV298_004760 [Trichoderma virens]
MEPLARIDNNFALQSNILSVYQDISENDQIREASKKSRKLFDAFRTQSFMREDVFALVNAVHDGSEGLDAESSLLLKLTYDRHIQMSVGLRDTKQKQRYKEIQAQLAEIKPAFRQNLNSDNSTVDFNLDDLKGVPDRILAKLDPKGAAQHQYQVTLSNPSHMEIMERATKSETRRRLFIASQNRCVGNGPLLKEAAILRYESANLLGFPDNAARQIQGRMAKIPDTVNKFLAELCSKLTPAGLASLNELEFLKRDDVSRQDELDQYDHSFFIWDYHFYHRLMLERHLGIDRQKIREYFPLQTTIAGMLSIFGSLFQLKFIELKGADKSSNMVWHEDTQVFQVHGIQKQSNHFHGYLYLDLFYRQGKYPNPACFNLQPVMQSSIGREFPFSDPV